MKPELSERLFIESLFDRSKSRIEFDVGELNHVERLTGDASTRRYYRLDTSSNSFVACIDNPSETNSNPFVTMQQFLNQYKVRVPKILDIKLNRGYILEEDLGDVTLLQYISNLQDGKHELDIFKKVIDSLLSIHRIPISDIEKAGIFRNSFDAEKLNSEIKFTTDFFVKRFLGVTAPEVIKEIESCFEPICNRASSGKMVFTHRDFHSRNIMVRNEELIVIDFQDARWGVPQYDLVSILEDCYYVIQPENKELLKRYYFDNLDVNIHGYESYSAFCKVYDDMAIQRVFKAVGSFSYIYETRKDVRYIKYIGFAMEKIKQIFFKDEQYSKLRKVLFKYYYES